jgi:23S rRNA C2498 (ribose-2'-O)-methylase RlmM
MKTENEIKEEIIRIEKDIKETKEELKKDHTNEDFKEYIRFARSFNMALRWALKSNT